MALQTSGPISLADVRTELQLSGRISLGDNAVRRLAEKPTGAISLSDFYGRSWVLGSRLYSATIVPTPPTKTNAYASWFFPADETLPLYKKKKHNYFSGDGSPLSANISVLLQPPPTPETPNPFFLFQPGNSGDGLTLKLKDFFEERYLSFSWDCEVLAESSVPFLKHGYALVLNDKVFLPKFAIGTTHMKLVIGNIFCYYDNVTPTDFWDQPVSFEVYECTLPWTPPSGFPAIY